MDNAVAAVRRFNRFFTQFVGALDVNFLDTGMSLAEARLLFEIAARGACFADELQAELDLDAGFVSRVLKRFEDRGWIVRSPLEQDRRRRAIELAEPGRLQFERLDRRQHMEVEAALARLGEPDRRRLIDALEMAQALLADADERAFVIRTFRPGDMGLIASRQSVLYREQYGWNSAIEVNEGEVTTAFLRDFKPGREQCWVAEVDGRMAGSIFLTDEGEGASRLRLLYVEPSFQGRGIGDALVCECVAFARSVGYRRITLWTQSILESARRIYARRGFRIVETQEHSLFGPRLLGETWALDLEAQSGSGEG
jgi:DNA-binding MarR family transcriptional regulator/N-acetylglutamate synthase-like GNAT family acetyltransferase